MKNLSIVSLAVFWMLSQLSQSALAQSTRVIKESLKSVVMIIAFDKDGQPTGIGSGFIINDKGDIATNYHVVEGAASAVVRLVGVDKKYAVTLIVRKSPKEDLAVIRARGLNAPALKLGDDIFQEVGEKIIAIGNPRGFSGTVSEGIISGFRKVSPTLRLMQITAPISPGSSGGPILTQKGEVIGVTTATITTAQNLNFAVPVTNLKALLKAVPINLPVSSRNLPVNREPLLADKTNKKGMVECKALKATGFGILKIEFSAAFRNHHNVDIRGIKAIVRFKNRQGEVVHFEALHFRDTIPSKFTKTVTKDVFTKLETSGLTPAITILDYEILSTSGKLEFK